MTDIARQDDLTPRIPVPRALVFAGSLRTPRDLERADFVERVRRCGPRLADRADTNGEES